MSKYEVLGAAVKAIREAKAAQAATDTHDPAAFKGSRFAIACGMSHAHLCNIEAGRKPKTPLDTIQRIAGQLGVPLAAVAYEVKVEYVEVGVDAA